MEKLFAAVAKYFIGKLVENYPVFDQILANNLKHQLPSQDVSPSQRKFLYLLTKIKGAKLILEIRTFDG